MFGNEPADSHHLAFPHHAKFDLLVIRRADDHPLHINAGQMDAVGVKASGRNHFFDADILCKKLGMLATLEI